MSKTPSIAVIPSGYKGGVEGVDGKVYSVLPTNGDADLEFTRNCVATRINQNGLIEEVLYNVPRLDYSDGGCPSLLLEPQRTNVCNKFYCGYQNRQASSVLTIYLNRSIVFSKWIGGLMLDYVQFLLTRIHL